MIAFRFLLIPSSPTIKLLSLVKTWLALSNLEDDYLLKIWLSVGYLDNKFLFFVSSYDSFLNENTLFTEIIG